jgi:hypothetical protein
MIHEVDDMFSLFFSLHFFRGFSDIFFFFELSLV